MMREVHKDNKIPTVGVLLAAYNGEKWIEEQISSILNQRSVSASIFISIDLSNDATENLALSLAARHSNITVLDQKSCERYGSAGRNFFRLISDVDIEEFDYIAFSDQDDFWFENKLSRAIDMLDKNEAHGYSSNVMAFWPDGRKALISKSQSQVEYDHFFESAGPGCTFVLSKELGLLLKRNVLENYGVIDKIWLHDWYCYFFARCHGFNWYIDELPSMLYRQHENNQVGANFGLDALRIRASVILKGTGFQRVIDNALFAGVSDHWIIKSLLLGKRRFFLQLAFMANKCRRRFSDKVLFFIVCIIFFFIGFKASEKT